MGIAVCLSNLKGGVGKTSSCHHLSGTLARAGNRVLLIDNDPQASLTQGFWGPDATRAVAAAESVAALYDPDLIPIPEALIRPTGVEGVAIVPGSPFLTDMNMTPRAEWGAAEHGIRDFLAECRDAFDVILIDTPPNLHLCTRAALVAADFLVTPLQSEDYGAQGLDPVRAAVAAVRSGPNPGLALAGYLLTMFDKRLTVHLAYETSLRRLYGDQVFASVIPRAKDFIEAVAIRQPVSHYKPRSAAAKAMQAVAGELLVRIGLEARDGAERGAA